MRFLLWLVVLGSLNVALFGGRYYLTPVELRWSRFEAVWYVAPLVLIFLLALTLLLLTRQSKTPDD